MHLSRLDFRDTDDVFFRKQVRFGRWHYDHPDRWIRLPAWGFLQLFCSKHSSETQRLSRMSFSCCSRDSRHMGSIVHWISPGDRQTLHYSYRWMTLELRSWLRSTVVERRSSAGELLFPKRSTELSLSCARPVADGRSFTWVSRPLQVSN